MGLANNPEVASWIESINQTEQSQGFEVLPENLTALEVFLAMQTNWLIVAGMAGVIHQGLNYTALQHVLNMMGISRRDWPDVFRDVRVLELSAIPILNEKG